jgi:hypothetical protein
MTVQQYQEILRSLEIFIQSGSANGREKMRAKCLRFVRNEIAPLLDILAHQEKRKGAKRKASDEK